MFLNYPCTRPTPHLDPDSREYTVYTKVSEEHATSIMRADDGGSRCTSCRQNHVTSPLREPPFPLIVFTYFMKIIFSRRCLKKCLYFALRTCFGVFLCIGNRNIKQICQVLYYHILIKTYRVKFSSAYTLTIHFSKSHSFFFLFLTLENGTDKLSRNVSKELPLPLRHEPEERSSQITQLFRGKVACMYYIN